MNPPCKLDFHDEPNQEHFPILVYLYLAVRDEYNDSGSRLILDMTVQQPIDYEDPPRSEYPFGEGCGCID